LKFFPEIESADGKTAVTSPSAGTVQVPTSVTFTHRGSYPVSTSDYLEAARTFDTLANKTYHLRWNPVDGFTLEDLADSGYNPSVLAESNVAFDSTYDDMLIARIVTSAGNVATITNLVNRDRYSTTVGRAAFVDIGGAGAQTDTYVLDLARTPEIALSKFSQNTTGSANDGGETAVFPTVKTRYSLSVQSYTISNGTTYATVYDYTVWL
jgi:hypothetical protein